MKFLSRLKKLPLRKILKLLTSNHRLQIQVFFFLAELIVKRTDNTLDDEWLNSMRGTLGHHDIEDLK